MLVLTGGGVDLERVTSGLGGRYSLPSLIRVLYWRHILDVIVAMYSLSFCFKIHLHVFANDPSNEKYWPAVTCTLKGLKVYFSPLSYSACILTLILRRSRTGTVWFYTSTSNKRAARPKLYTKSLTRDLKPMYSRFTLVRISINL